MTELKNVEIPRDRWGRPMILQPNGKRVGYRRTTTFVGCLEDTYNLMAWKQRQTVLGMGQRKDLIVAAAAADPNDKKLLNELAEKACEAAVAGGAATTGTALHSLTERVDKGQQLGYVPAEFEADIAAYQAATKHLEWTGIESFRVHDEWKVAGTADRIGRGPDGRLRIFDIKTGSIDYPHKMAMQLAMYAHSVPYDIETDTRGEPDGVDQNTGVIIHLPAGQGRCDLYEINLAKGWGACLIARKVWDWRNTKDLTHLIGDERKDTWQKANDPDRGAHVAATQLSAVKTLDELRALWRQAAERGLLTDDFRAAIQDRSEQLTGAA